MVNFVTVLKEEIVRLARKELRIETEGLKKASAQYRSDIAALKRKVAQLEKQVSRLEKTNAKSNAGVNVEPEVASRARFTAKGFVTLRKRLGLSAADVGKLIGVSVQTIYSWEAGTSSPRSQQLAKIVILRGMGKKEVDALLLEHAG